MIAATVEFVGGPADGRLTVIPADPFNPPLYYELRTPDGDRLIYRCEVNPTDDGPLWHYQYDTTVRREERAP
ncbi:hypothetical protein ACPCUF_01025 [Streptomyces griseoincarnatus]